MTGKVPSPRRLRANVSIIGLARFAQLPSRSTLVRWVKLALLGDAQISLVFVDARAGRRLNRTYRQRDYATNVLTFAYQEHPVVLADVVICVPVARAEAAKQSKTLRQHLAHLIIHGVLHAQGHDHMRAADARRMRALEIAHLARLRIPDPYPSMA